jgi:hypothetical protein
MVRSNDCGRPPPVPLAVFGAHLSCVPPKPGLVRVLDRGASIEAEL